MSNLQRWAMRLAIGAAAVYTSRAVFEWARFGDRRPRGLTEPEADPLLDSFMPAFDVVERHAVAVHAPAEATMAAARQADLMDSLLVRLIVRAREVLLGAHPARTSGQVEPHGLIARALAQGWGQLAEVPGREVIMGAVTQPWQPNVVFRALPPAEFAAYYEPGFVKIAWTLRVDAVFPDHTIFRTETRAIAYGAAARSKFRVYWALLSPGIVLIRHAVLAGLLSEATKLSRGASSTPAPPTAAPSKCSAAGGPA